MGVGARTILIVKIFRARIGRGRDSLVGHGVHDGNIFFKLGGIVWEGEQVHAQRIGGILPHDKIFFHLLFIFFLIFMLDIATQHASNVFISD